MSLVIFAEGSEHRPGSAPSPSFQRLWQTLSNRCGFTQEPRVIGFSKGHIVKMGRRILGDAADFKFGPMQRDTVPLNLPPRKLVSGPNGLSEIGLDILISDENKRIKAIDSSKCITRVIIAFDLEPKYNELDKRCRRAERMLVIHCLRHSQYIPEHLKQAAEGLWQFYHDKHLSTKPEPRQEGDPRFPIELILMKPCFENLILEDETWMFQKLHPEAKKRPADWPSFKSAHQKDADRRIFLEACRSAAKAVKGRLQDDCCDDKHLWAEYILRDIPDYSSTMRHEIISRLRMNLQGL